MGKVRGVQEKGGRRSQCTDMREMPPGTAWGALGGTERQIGVAKPVSGKEVSNASGSRRIMTSALRQTLIEQKLIEINTPEDISGRWYELINSPAQSEIPP